MSAAGFGSGRQRPSRERERAREREREENIDHTKKGHLASEGT